MRLRGGKVGQSEKDALNALVAGLGQLVEASFAKSEQRRRIQSFLEQRVDAEDTFEAQARTLDSNAIVDTLTEMTDVAEESLTTTRKRKAEAAQEHRHWRRVANLEGAVTCPTPEGAGLPASAWEVRVGAGAVAA